MDKKEIEKLFTILNKYNYIYFRDYDYLRTDLSKEDVDIVLKKTEDEKLKKELLNFGYVTFDKSYPSKRDGVYTHIENKYPLLGVHLNKLVKMPYLENIDFNEKEKDKLINIFNEENQIKMFFFKDLFLSGLFSVKKISPSKQKKIEQLLQKRKNRTIIQTYISKQFLRPQYIYNLFKEKQFNTIHKQRTYIKLLFYMKNPLKVKYLINNVWGIFLKTIINSKPITTAILGVDGVGKTTIINKYKSLYDINNKKAKLIYMGRWTGFVLPIHWIKQNPKRKITLSMDEIDNSKKVNSKLKFLNIILRDIFFILEYTARYFVHILPAKIMRTNIIYDRYVYDLHLLKKRTKLLDFFVWIYPKPKQLIVLYDDAKKIWQRKKELTPKELDRQQKILRNIKNKRKINIHNVTIIETIKKIFSNQYN